MRNSDFCNEMACFQICPFSGHGLNYSMLTDMYVAFLHFLSSYSKCTCGYILMSRHLLPLLHLNYKNLLKGKPGLIIMHQLISDSWCSIIKSNHLKTADLSSFPNKCTQFKLIEINLKQRTFYFQWSNSLQYRADSLHTSGIIVSFATFQQQYISQQ